MSSLSNLADCYGDEKDSKILFSLRTKIFRGSAVALGGDHPFTIQAMCDFALALWDAGEKIKALTLLRTALRRNCRILGLRHDNTIMCAGLLCGFLRDFGYGDLSDFIYKKHLAWMGEPAAHQHQFGFHTRKVVDIIRKNQLTLKVERLVIIRYEFKMVTILQNMPD